MFIAAVVIIVIFVGFSINVILIKLTFIWNFFSLGLVDRLGLIPSLSVRAADRPDPDGGK